MRVDLLAIPDQTVRFWWLSSKAMTVGVLTNDRHIVTGGAPITQRFWGQPLTNLIEWMKRQDGFQMREMK